MVGSWMVALSIVPESLPVLVVLVWKWTVYIDDNGNTTFQYNRGFGIINSALGSPAVPNSTTFSVGAVSGTDNTVPSQIPLVSIRLSPSVDSSLSGALGEREIINRMQLQLNSLDVVNTHECEIKLILNPSLSTDSYLDVAPPSLSQLIKHTVDDTYAGGLEIFSFRAAGGQIDTTGKRGTGSISYDISPSLKWVTPSLVVTVSSRTDLTS